MGGYMTKGRILSIESMGLVDGPGIRTVVFLKGCPLRCLFCHNPDSWNASEVIEMSADELLKKILRFKPYFERSGGGVTFSGGEPLLQKDFLLECLKKCKEAGIHTCLDTSGVGVGGYEEILELCDLVLFDVKATERESYEKMCQREMAECENFLEALSKVRPETVIRQVVVPGINDTDEYMKNLKIYIESKIPFYKDVELLPFHKMGEYKYEALGIEPPLANTPAMDKEKCETFKKKYFGGQTL